MKRLLRVLLLLLAFACVFAACDNETLRSITGSEIVNDELVLSFSDGTTENLGKVVGKNGVDGEDGPQGPQGEKAEVENSQELAFYLLSNGTYGVSAGNSIYLESVVIPETYKGKSVTMILPRAFENSQGVLKKVAIPNTIVEICNGAFKGCENLEEIDFGTNSKLKKIGDDAFSECRKIKNISIPQNVESVGEEAFGGCYMLETVVFEKNSKLTSLGSYAFSYCTNLKSVVIPIGVVGIPAGVFSDCRKLSTVYYGGDSDQWGTIWKSGLDTTNTAVYYYSPVRPNVTGGKFWRYVSGVPTPW